MMKRDPYVPLTRKEVRILLEFAQSQKGEWNTYGTPTNTVQQRLLKALKDWPANGNSPHEIQLNEAYVSLLRKGGNLESVTDQIFDIVQACERQEK